MLIIVLRVAIIADYVLRPLVLMLIGAALVKYLATRQAKPSR